MEVKFCRLRNAEKTDTEKWVTVHEGYLYSTFKEFVYLGKVNNNCICIFSLSHLPYYDRLSSAE